MIVTSAMIKSTKSVTCLRKDENIERSKLRRVGRHDVGHKCPCWTELICHMHKIIIRTDKNERLEDSHPEFRNSFESVKQRLFEEKKGLQCRRQGIELSPRV